MAGEMSDQVKTRNNSLLQNNAMQSNVGTLRSGFLGLYLQVRIPTSRYRSGSSVNTSQWTVCYMFLLKIHTAVAN